LYGPGWIEGQTEPVSADTIARLACTGSTSTITFDENGQPIDVSSEQRLFGRKQRHGLSARDGGCMWTDASGAHTCDRPPSWTEAHHVEQWDRDGGKTTILNGILLCKYHHLTLHNDGWEIHRVGTRYWLIPPVTVDRAQTPRLIRSRSDAYAQLDHLAHRTGPAAPPPATERVDTARAADPPEPDERTTSTGMTYLYVPRRNSTHASNRNAAASTDPPSDQQSDATGPAEPGSPPAR
ncbi:MAG: HNH endonuclease signature motif containing protein, partial [Glaciihabitans sp.]